MGGVASTEKGSTHWRSSWGLVGPTQGLAWTAYNDKQHHHYHFFSVCVTVHAATIDPPTITSTSVET